MGIEPTPDAATSTRSPPAAALAALAASDKI